MKPTIQCPVHENFSLNDSYFLSMSVHVLLHHNFIACILHYCTGMSTLLLFLWCYGCVYVLQCVWALMLWSYIPRSWSCTAPESRVLRNLLALSLEEALMLVGKGRRRSCLHSYGTQYVRGDAGSFMELGLGSTTFWASGSSYLTSLLISTSIKLPWS